MAHSCAFFNNKGGVGKTTNIANLGDRLARSANVVVVDLDPQCNVTQYYMEDESWEALYFDQAKSVDGTLWRIVRPIAQSKVLNHDNVGAIPLQNTGRFGFNLVAGHPFISRLDDSLAEQWGNYRLAKVGGIETTFWCHQLISALENQIPELDFVLFDLGPSLGPLNRTVLMACDFFVAPVSPDLFSLYSFDNLRSWFHDLRQSIAGARTMLSQDTDDYSESWWFEKFQAGLTVRFNGYISQEYVTRTTKGERRKTRAYARFFEEMPQKARQLAELLKSDNEVVDTTALEIGVMPHMYSMVSLAQDAHAPIGDLKGSDGLNGAQFRQRDRYVEDMDTICGEWLRRMNSGGGPGRDAV